MHAVSLAPSAGAQGELAGKRGAKRAQAERAKAEAQQQLAEIQRVRLGTRLPAYLPQRITPELCEILARFRAAAAEEGIRQFVVQTHYESPMEITPESRDAVARLLAAGFTFEHATLEAALRAELDEPAIRSA